MNREQLIAHLEIHGWQPMKNSTAERCGIYNDQLGIGFSVRNDDHRIPAGDSAVKRWDRSHKSENYGGCSWDEVTDWHLQKIETRLSET